jgi:ATP-binding cassette subfamily C protein
VWNDLRTTLRWLTPRERARWFVLAPIAALSAAFEAASALAVYGLLRLVIDPGRVATTPVVSRLSERWPGADPASIVAVAIGVTAVFYTVRGLLLAWAEWLAERAVHQSSARVAERLIARMLAADYLVHTRRASAATIEEVSRSSELAFSLVAASVVRLVAEGLVIAALVTVLAATAPRSTLVAVALVGALAAVVLVSTRRVWIRLGAREKALAISQLQVLQQSLGAIKGVIVTGRQAYFEERFRAVRRPLARLKEQRQWLASTLRVGVETTLMLSMLLVMLLVVLDRSFSADTVSSLALFAYTGFRLVPSVNRVMVHIASLHDGHAFVHGIDEHLSAPAGAARPQPTAPQLSFERGIRFDHVSFQYDEGLEPSISEIDLAIAKGESVGVVGPTGAGKSTFVDVLLGLLTPTSGQVLIDDQPLEGRTRAWQSLIGYVPQTVFLLDDTLRRNVAFGIADAAIDDARVQRAVALAQLDGAVATWPHRLETIVGENGVRLSGGERQRVAIARALYHDPPVLVFDEATSALDTQTERELAAALAAFHGGRTVIAIAHRLATVKDCDRLIYLRDGRLQGMGPYSALVSDPTFRTLA